MAILLGFFRESELDENCIQKVKKIKLAIFRSGMFTYDYICVVCLVEKESCKGRILNKLF